MPGSGIIQIKVIPIKKDNQLFVPNQSPDKLSKFLNSVCNDLGRIITVVDKSLMLQSRKQSDLAVCSPVVCRNICRQGNLLKAVISAGFAPRLTKLLNIPIFFYQKLLKCLLIGLADVNASLS